MTNITSTASRSPSLGADFIAHAVRIPNAGSTNAGLPTESVSMSTGELQAFWRRSPCIPTLWCADSVAGHASGPDREVLNDREEGRENSANH